MTTVVTAQLLLDILDASDDPSFFYKHLSFSRKHASDTFDFELQNRGQVLATRGGLNWPDTGQRQLTRIYGFLKELENPKFPLMRALMLQIKTRTKMNTRANTTPEQRAHVGTFWSNQRPPPNMEAAFSG